MPSYQVDILPGQSAPTDHAESWNDLWSRDPAASPTALAETTAAWWEHFAAGDACETVIVRNGSRWLALLPVTACHWGKLIPAGGLPRNEWCEAGDLIVDPTADVAEISRVLWACLAERPWSIYRFSFVHPEKIGWKSLLKAMADVGVSADQRTMFEVPVLPVRAPWEATWGSLSKNFRKSLRRAEKRLRARGHLDFQFVVPESCEENAHWLAAALAIEDSGWKGRRGSSVVKQAGLASLVRRLTNALAASRHVAYAWLRLDGQPIAFELLWWDKRTVHCFKVGYNEQLSREQPGNILLWNVLRHLTEQTAVEAYDCIGPMTPGLARWPGVTRPVLRVTAAPRNVLGSTLITLYRSCWKPSAPRVEHANLRERRGATEAVPRH